MTFSFLYLVAAFGGGILGAALGGLPVFILCGVAAIVGAGITAATGDATFSNLVAWGPLLGPQVSFAGGAAAAVYAMKKGKLGSGRDIGSALMGLNSPDVLLVGGLFGVLGYVLQWLISLLPMIGSLPFTNAIALSIVINAIIARLVFGKTGVFGKVRAGDNRWLASDVAAWLPWQNSPLQLLTVGLGFGLVVAWTTVQSPAMAGLWFGVATVGLVFLQFNVKVPVWHHIALSAEQAIAVAGGDMWWGVAFAVMSAFIGDFYGQLFLAHGDSHIDPPSASLFTTFIIMAIFKAVGLFEISGIGSAVAVVVIAVVFYAISAAMKSRKNVVEAKAQA
ncbi:MAG: permease [Anaerolineaceae bacterium]